MSIRLILAGYLLCILAALFGTGALMRYGHGSRKLLWLFAGLSCILLALILFASISILPVFFTAVLPNLAILTAFILFHQAVAEILESSRRYLGVSMVLVGAQFVTYLGFTYSQPSLRDRIVIRTTALAIQCLLTLSILIQNRNQSPRDARTISAWVFSCFLALQIARIASTFIWVPSFDLAHGLDPIQALYSNFSFCIGFAAVLSIVWLDLSAQRENLRVMATTDGLSGLMNRRTFDQVLQRELEYAERLSQPVALLMIDIDHFKEVNDQFGHAAGDEVIRRISRLLCVNTRATDAVARYGGEEFAMVLRGMQLEQAQSIAERLRTQIQTMVGLPDPIRVTASIGIAVACPGDTVATLMRRSDHALYESKRSGRNRVCIELACNES